MRNLKKAVWFSLVLLILLTATACKNQQADADVCVPFGFEVFDGDAKENAEILKSLDKIKKSVSDNPGFGKAQFEAAELVVIMKPRHTYLADKSGTLTGETTPGACYTVVADGQYLCDVGVSRLSNGEIDGVSISATIESSQSERIKNCCKDNKDRKVIIYFPSDGTQPVEFDDENAADSDENKVLCVLKDTRKK